METKMRSPAEGWFLLFFFFEKICFTQEQKIQA